MDWSSPFLPGFGEWGRHRFVSPLQTWISVTTTTRPLAAPPVADEHIRKIVREEIADLLPVDVPDTPPENL